MSSGVHLLTDLIASARAAVHCEFFDAAPSAVKGMFIGRVRRSLGLTAHRGWARVLLGRMDSQVQRPEHPKPLETVCGSSLISLEEDEAMDAFLYHLPPSGFEHEFSGVAR